MTQVINFIIDNPFLTFFIFLIAETNIMFIYLYLTQITNKTLPHPLELPRSTNITSLVIEVNHPVEYFFNKSANESLQMGYKPCSDKLYIEGKWRQFMTISIQTNYNQNLIEGEN